MGDEGRETRDEGREHPSAFAPWTTGLPVGLHRPSEAIVRRTSLLNF